MPDPVILCGDGGCRLLQGHSGQHKRFPSAPWRFMAERDRDKLAKAGFATPRGGSKGAYQNHVLRSNRVIIPFERLNQVTLSNYSSGYVIRLFPEQYFASPGVPKAEFTAVGAVVNVGVNAFVLYRTHRAIEEFPPPAGWQPRRLQLNGVEVEERGPGVVDTGHYVKRISAADNARRAAEEGYPQGIFAPEYADEETNFLCKCVLAWLTVNCIDSPYTTEQASHVEAVLVAAGVIDRSQWESKGILRSGITCCPLCLHFLKYSELHEMVSFSEEAGLVNASEQVAGSTRSTIINLFHMMPLTYSAVEHIPANVAWGHAVCNTRLGQRICHSVDDVRAHGLKVGIITDAGVRTFGWITQDYEMIRSPRGAVWIRLHRDMTSEEWDWLPGQPVEVVDDAAIDRNVAE